MNCKDTEVVTKFTSGIRSKRRRKKKNQSRASWKILFISFLQKVSMNCFTFSFKGDCSSNPQGKRDLFFLKMLSGFYEEGILSAPIEE